MEMHVSLIVTEMVIQMMKMCVRTTREFLRLISGHTVLLHWIQLEIRKSILNGLYCMAYVDFFFSKFWFEQFVQDHLLYEGVLLFPIGIPFSNYYIQLHLYTYLFNLIFWFSWLKTCPLHPQKMNGRCGAFLKRINSSVWKWDTFISEFTKYKYILINHFSII